MMTLDRKIEVYAAQNRGGLKVTGPQQRRLNKTAYREARMASDAPVNVCGTCHAVNDDPCITATGKPAKQAHKGRYALAV
jgi:hypothetical protein